MHAGAHKAYHEDVTLSVEDLLRHIRALPRPERYRLARTLVDDLSEHDYAEPQPFDRSDEDVAELQRTLAKSRITQPLGPRKG
jgi:hypothetical protein